RAVAGIGHYGNSIGVPTVGGEVSFEAPYEQNCLINAMCVGLGERARLVRAAAAGPGNLVVLMGASTGRDGIGGASVLAAAEPDGLDVVLALCARWEVGAAAIGEVTGGGRLRVLRGDAVEGDVPVAALVDECPLYDLDPVEPAEPLYSAPPRTLEGDDPREAL